MHEGRKSALGRTSFFGVTQRSKGERVGVGSGWA